MDWSVGVKGGEGKGERGRRKRQGGRQGWRVRDGERERDPVLRTYKS